MLGRRAALAPLAPDDLADLALFADTPEHDVQMLVNPQWQAPRVVSGAIRFLLDKALMTPEQFAALADGYKSAGFAIAGVTEEYALEVARDALVRAVRDGLTGAQAADAIQRALDGAGFEALQPRHAVTVARTNLASAYGAGQWDALHDPRLADALPAYRYVTMEDERVRPTHAAMHGFIAQRDDPTWDRWWPPNGYNCRCVAVAITADQWQGISDDVPTLLGHRVEPDPDFDGSPRGYLRAHMDPAARRRWVDVNRLARKLAADYVVPEGYEVVEVFAEGESTR